MSRILVVEDDADLRDAISTALEDEGYACDACGNGAEALERLRDSDLPDLLILDLMMPVMDGWTLRRELLADARLCLLPVLVLSASRALTTETLEPARYVRKPVELEKLLEVVGELIGPP